MKLTTTALALTLLAPGALANCPKFKGMDLWQPNTPFRSVHEENANRVATAIEGGNRVEIDEAVEESVGTVPDGGHCVANSECASFIEENGGNRADPGTTPPRTQSCCVAYPQGTTPGAYSMSFCWNPSSCNSLGQVKCIEEIDLEVPDEPVPMSAELPLDAINFIQNLDGACADVTTPEECKAILENDMTTSSGYGRGTAVAFGAALLAGVSLLN